MDDHNKLKPTDIKDIIERPDNFNNQAAKFNTWSDKFKDSLTGTRTVGGHQQEWVSVDQEPEGLHEQPRRRHLQLHQRTVRHLSTTLDKLPENLHARLTQTDCDEVMELMLEVIYLQRSQSELQSSQANKANELDNFLTEWRHTRKMEDPKCKMDDETMQSILLREDLAQGKHDGTLGFPGHTKERQGKKQKFKKKEEKATKEKEKDNCLDLASVQLGDRHFARRGQLPVTVGPLCATVRNFLSVQRGRAKLEDSKRPKRDQRTH